ncbi:isopentenyl-diphosphate Delta-isomerase [Sediminibacterium ginsengisoli]|uniref:Isopentenyl-diphosphate delta-isomerase n=1 Tax=Sediminibacterium ginsengisoli TaxID=413434 RepID=A0A1T4JUV5_9BACT|nr:isopentenyl-diphosphate Delta-isomerase [Sediminibacterium ginsengisoli]SJZ33941.1 isopentenyl-diphosphate delta-isomerase [Sediminibacterium ginsengisoli]
MEHVILVDESDLETGVAEKIAAHRDGLLHRAFSVFIFNSDGELLLQQRAKDKYHSGGLWTNTCCSHPRPAEDIAAAAERRLQEEMGFTVPLEKALDFIYKAPLANGLTEYEYDHVFIGYYDGEIMPDISEVMDHDFLSFEMLDVLMKKEPSSFTAWFHIALPLVRSWLERRNEQMTA